jgi:hypothetical protein
VYETWIPRGPEAFTNAFPTVIFHPAALRSWHECYGFIHGKALTGPQEERHATMRRLSEQFLWNFVHLALCKSGFTWAQEEHVWWDDQIKHVSYTNALPDRAVLVFGDDPLSFYWEERRLSPGWMHNWQNRFSPGHDREESICACFPGPRAGMNGGVIFHPGSIDSDHGPWSIHT